MRILTEQKEIQNAQNRLIGWLASHCNVIIPVKLGHQGETVECSINWSASDGLWFYSRNIPESRYWNAFGIAEIRPSVGSLLPIICEINPPIEGLNLFTQGAFVQKNDDSIFLAHRGKIGGGRPGIGRTLFFNNYVGVVKDINGKKFAFLGEINSADIVMKILNFVQEVNRIKNM